MQALAEGATRKGLTSWTQGFITLKASAWCKVPHHHSYCSYQPLLCGPAEHQLQQNLCFTCDSMSAFEMNTPKRATVPPNARQEDPVEKRVPLTRSPQHNLDECDMQTARPHYSMHDSNSHGCMCKTSRTGYERKSLKV